jgi:dihydrofolate synthase/folylpolyglutamate synthase
VGAPLPVVRPAPVLGLDGDGIQVDLPRLGPTRVGLRGRHQAANVAVADAMLDALEAAGIARADPEARRSGYAAATWPGRLELLDIDGVEVLLDGAHNPAGAATLAVALDDLRPFLAPGPLTLVVASMADKDVDGVIDALSRATALSGATVIATTVDAARAMAADELAARWRARSRGVTTVLVRPDPVDAVETALATARHVNGATVVAGSLYLVGAVRAHLVDDPELRDPPSR